MKLYVDVNGLTKVTLLDDNNNVVFEKNCFYEKLKDTFDEINTRFSCASVGQVYLTGPTKMVNHLMPEMHPVFTNAMYSLNGGF